MKKKRKSTRIFIQLEKDGKFIRKRLTKRMLCSLSDLQYMMDESDTWYTLKLNRIDGDVSKFFRIIEHLDGADHGNQSGSFQPEKYHVHKDKKGKITLLKQKSKMVWSKGNYMYGKPRWKKLKKQKRK